MELSARDLLNFIEVTSAYDSEKAVEFIGALLREIEKLQGELEPLKVQVQRQEATIRDYKATDRRMVWRKAEPGSMPPDKEPVYVTAFHDGYVEPEENELEEEDEEREKKEPEREVIPCARWNENAQVWEIKWGYFDDWTSHHDLIVTHWMPYHTPAESRGGNSMNWTKVTPETMPPKSDTGYYMCAAETIEGESVVTCRPALYDSEYGFHYVIDNERVSIENDKIAKVTHWMPWPEPADG